MGRLVRSFQRWWKNKPPPYKTAADTEAAFWGDFTARWIVTGLIPPWADVRLAIAQAISLGHKDRLLGGELENLSRKLRFLRDALHHVSSLARRRPTRVLELGCGAGFLSLEMGRQGAEVLGVDISAGQIAVARYFSQNGMRWPEALYPVYQGLGLSPSVFRQPVYEILDLNRQDPEGIFDVILAHDSIHHIISSESLIRRLDSLLEPGGWLLIIDYQETDDAEKVLSAFRDLLADLCFQSGQESLPSDLPKVERYNEEVSFPAELGREVMQGLADWLREEGFPMRSVSEATGESVPPPWPTEESSFEGVGKSDLGRRLQQTTQLLDYQEVTFQTAFEPWLEDLPRLRPESMDWSTFYALRAEAENQVLTEYPNAGRFFYLKARKLEISN